MSLNKFFNKDLLTKNKLTKLVVIPLAIAVWFYATGRQAIEINKSASLEIIVDSGMVISKTSTQKIMLKLKGNKDYIDSIESTPTIKIDLSNHKNPTNLDVILHRKNIKLPPSVDVRFIPDTVRIFIDELTEKTLPIEVPLSGETFSDYQISNIFTNPRKIKIKGPANILKELKTIKTQALDITGRVENFREVLPLEQLPGSEQKLIKVYVQITESLSERKFSNSPIHILSSPAQHSEVTLLIPSSAEITVTGPREDLENLSSSSIIPFVSISGLSTGKYELPLQIVPLKNIKLVNTSPKNIDVNIGVRIKEKSL